MPGSSSPTDRWTTLRRALPAAAAALSLCLAVSSAEAQTIKFIESDPQQAGTAQPRQLGLPETLWAGGTRQGLGEAMDAVEATGIVAAHRALSDLLKAAAAPPAPASEGETLDPPLIARRVAALARLGAENEALALAARAPQQFRTSGILATEADIRLLRNDLAGACNLPTGNPAATATTDWQKLRAFCSHALGQPDAAMASAMLGSLTAGTADDTFAAMFLALQFPDGAKPAGIVPAQPLHAAMYRFLRLRPAGAQELPEAPATVLASLSRNPNLPIALRTIAMERAVAANTGSADVLAQLYLEGGGTEGVGPAYRSAAFAQNAQAKLAALQTLWSAAREAGLAAQLSPLTVGMAAVGDPAAASPDVMLGALRAALLSRDKPNINAWRNALNTAARQPEGAANRDRSYALLALAGESVPAAEQWWADWLAAAKPSDAQQQLVGGTLGAFGYAFALMPSPRISRNSAAGKIAQLAENAPGEAALRALAALGDGSEADAAMQVTAVRTLALLHPGHARALALELAIASGL